MSQISQNPFPGLRSFEYEESHLFFGREQHIRDLLDKLQQNHFVAIVGTSGSGKSSLVRAGLLPAIHSGKMNDGNKSWLIASMKPGNTPIKNLANSLMKDRVFRSGDQAKDQETHERVEKLLNASSLGLVQSVRSLIPPDTSLLILLDQFEETFRFTGEGIEHNDEESEKFVNLVIDAVRQRDVPIYVVLTIRSDFLGDCVRFEGLPEAINDGHYLVPRLNEKQNKLVITGPVNYANGKISPRLVQLVTNDLGDNPDQLPVLQHALMRTWDKWIETAEVGEPMDIRHYEMTGTMKHALSYHADEAFNELKGEPQKKLIEHVFKCLTVKTGENRGVRRPTSVKNLLQITGASFSELEEVLYPFRKTGRTFILPPEGNAISENTVLDISHESLMRGWERMKQWVEEETESAEIYQRLCTGALLYKDGQAGLWRDPELQVALDWKAKSDPNEAWARQYNEHFDLAISFLNASAEERTAELNRKLKRSRLLKTAVIAFLCIVSVLTTWALWQTKKATEKSRIAEQKTLEALDQKQLAEKSKEMALAASRQALDAKSFAELQANIAGEQKRMADEQKLKAENEAYRATTQEQEALKQKQLAEQKSREALMQKQKADSSQQKAERLRLVALGQNIAVKSLQQKEDNQLSALLAYQSYKMASENGGNLNDPELYNALYFAAEKIDPSFKSMFAREQSSSVALSVSGAVLSSVFENGFLKTYYENGAKFKSKTTLGNLTSPFNTAYLDSKGKMAAIGTENYDVIIYDLENNSQSHVLKGHRGLVRSVEFSDDGKLIATGGRDSSVILWENYALLKELRFSSRVKVVLMDKNKANLYIGAEDGSVYSYEISSGKKAELISNKGARVQSMSLDSDTRNLAIGYSNGTVQVLKTNGSLLRTINQNSSIDFICIDSGEDFLITAAANKTIQVYSLSGVSQKPISIKCPGTVNAMAVSNGDFVYAACDDNSIRYYPLHTSWFEKSLKANIKRDFTPEEWNAYIGPNVTQIKSE